MIPTLQLDPSTLAIWFNVDLLNSYKGEERGFEVFTHAANDNLGEAYPILDDAVSDAHRSHYYEILSAVWHEKRHFVDFLLTNYGAFHVRTLASEPNLFYRMIDSRSASMAKNTVT